MDKPSSKEYPSFKTKTSRSSRPEYKQDCDDYICQNVDIIHHSSKQTETQWSKDDININTDNDDRYKYLLGKIHRSCGYTSTHCSTQKSKMSSSQWSYISESQSISCIKEAKTVSDLNSPIEPPDYNDINDFTALDGIHLGADDSALNPEEEKKALNNATDVTETYGFTLQLFKKALMTSPGILHLTFHGEYTQLPREAAYILFDSTPVFVSLITSPLTILKNEKTLFFREYMVSIAILFEDELIRFVHQKKQSKPMYSHLPCPTHWFNPQIPTDVLFEPFPLLKHMFIEIASRRFGCYVCNNRAQKRLQLWYGDCRLVSSDDDGRLRLDYIKKPFCPLNPFRLRQAYADNENVQTILRRIECRYKALKKRNNDPQYRTDGSYQKYCWALMVHAIKQKIPMEIWNELRNTAHRLDNIEFDGGDPAEFDNTNINNFYTKGEFYDLCDLTFVLKIQPIGINTKTLEIGRNCDNLRALIHAEIGKVIHRMKQNADVRIAWTSEFSDHEEECINIKIIEFENISSVSIVQKKVIAYFKKLYKKQNKTKSRPKMQYKITFKPMATAKKEHHMYCGYIPLNVQKRVLLDRNGRNDQIRNIVRECWPTPKHCKIKLLLLMGCHSYHLAQIFKHYVGCVICVHPRTQIDDKTCIKFSQSFYGSFSRYYRHNRPLKYVIMAAFYEAKSWVKKYCKFDNKCSLHSHCVEDAMIDPFHNEFEELMHENNHTFNEHNKESYLKLLQKWKSPNLKWHRQPCIMVHGITPELVYEIKQDFEKGNKFHLGCQYNAIERMLKDNPSFQSNVKKRKPSISIELELRDDKVTESIPMEVEVSNELPQMQPTLHSRGSVSKGQVVMNDLLSPPISDTNLLFIQRSIAVDSDDDDYDDDHKEYLEYERKISVKDDYYFQSQNLTKSPEFDYWIIQFQTEQDKRTAFGLLEDRKIKEEQMVNSLVKERQSLSSMNLGWYYTDIPVCCCDNESPHSVENKLILLIDGQNINCAIDLSAFDVPNLNLKIQPIIKARSSIL